MSILFSKKELTIRVAQLKKENLSIGFVPTMGALHEGHVSLIDYALNFHSIVVVSIFVNPTQFNNPKDLEKYPRTLDSDQAILSKYGDVVLIYAPSPSEVYGSIVQSKSYNFGGLETVMEGEHRPGHFDGVGTVLSLLFEQVTPDEAFFGEKDFQQLQIVKKLVDIEQIPIKITGCPIHRQKNGLAMSSRNKRLTSEQLEIAPFIYETLQFARVNFSTFSALKLKNKISEMYKSQQGLNLEYFEIVNIKNLQPLSRKRKNQKYRAFVAAYAGEVRLIDNIALNY